MIELRTERLLLRPVAADDLEVIAAFSADERVMAHLGGPASPEKIAVWMEMQLAHWRTHRFGRFVIEREGLFVGLVGLSRTDFDAGIVPAVEIAWRLVFDPWGHGYVTEGARAVIADGFGRIGLGELVGVTTTANLRSRRVMERLAMNFSPSETFDHPLVPEGDPLRQHVVYRLAHVTRA